MERPKEQAKAASKVARQPGLREVTAALNAAAENVAKPSRDEAVKSIDALAVDAMESGDPTACLLEWASILENAAARLKA